MRIIKSFGNKLEIMNMLILRNIFVLVLVVLFLASPLTSCAKKEPAENVIIENLFIKSLAPGQTTAAAYMKFTNNTKQAQSLTYVHSPVAENIEVHRNFYEQGMMQMRPVKRFIIPPNGKHVLEPGGFHLMIFGVYDKLNVGDTFDMTFEFDSGIVMTKSVEVRPHG